MYKFPTLPVDESRSDVPLKNWPMHFALWDAPVVSFRQKEADAFEGACETRDGPCQIDFMH